MSRSQGSSSALAALGLAVLTLAVFFLLQNYGPESAIGRFHQASVSGDDAELAQVIVQDVRAQSVRWLRSNIVEWSRMGAAPVLSRVRREQGWVIAQVDYVSPLRTDNVWWVVVRKPEGWRIDADATVDMVQQTLRF